MTDKTERDEFETAIKGGWYEEDENIVAAAWSLWQARATLTPATQPLQWPYDEDFEKDRQRLCAQVAPLSSRLRPGIECAPWVIDEVKRLEAIAMPLQPMTDAAQDVARYRLLRQLMIFIDGVPPTMMLSVPLQAVHNFDDDCIGDRFDASVDATVDAEIERIERAGDDHA